MWLVVEFPMVRKYNSFLLLHLFYLAKATKPDPLIDQREETNCNYFTCEGGNKNKIWDLDKKEK